MQWTTATNFAIRHAMTSRSSTQQQQQLQQQQYSNTLQSSSRKQQQKYMGYIYKYILDRRAAAYSSLIIVDQVKVLCCETAHSAYVTKRETTDACNNKHTAVQQ